MEAVKNLRLKALPITENDIKRQVKDYLDLKGYFHFHLLAGMGCYPGLPDRIAIKGGKVLFLEIKKPKGWKHSDSQIKFQQDIEKAGGKYLLVRKLEDLIEGLGGG